MYNQDTVKRVIDGDMDAFSMMYNDLSSTVYRRVYDIVQDHAKAREVVRNVFLDIHRHCPQLRDSSLFDEWLESLIQFYSGQGDQEGAMNNNPDLQLVWNDITATIASTMQIENEATTNHMDETVENNEILRLNTKSMEESDAPISVGISDDDIKTNYIFEIKQDIESIKEDKVVDANLEEERAEMEERFPGVDFEVAKLIDQLQTDDWSPILFPPDDDNDQIHYSRQLINELPWMRGDIIEIDDKENSADLDDIDALLDEVEDSLRAARVEESQKQVRDEEDALIQEEFAAYEDLSAQSSSDNQQQDITNNIETSTAEKENADTQSTENIMYFPSNSSLMDKTAVERDDPPDWLTSGPLPNIDEAFTAKLDGYSNQNSAAVSDVIVGTTALQAEPELSALPEESPDEIDVEIVEDEKEASEEPKKTQVFFESVNVEVDQVNSSISYARVPYEYIPYEEATQEIYDRLNEEYEEQALESQEKFKPQIQYQGAEKIKEPSYKEELPKMESVSLPPKAKKKKTGAVVAVVITLVVIGGAFVYAKISGLI